MSIETSEIHRGWLKPSASILLAFVFLPLAATALLSGKSSVEKMLTNMVQPLFVAIVIALIFGFVLVRRKERTIGVLLIGGACLLWTLSSKAFVDILFRSWESPIVSSEQESTEPWDYLIVLGGGTSSAPDGRPQLGFAGDRVDFAARLFLAGKAKKLVTTGDNVTLTGMLAGSLQPKDDPSQQTIKIWTELGIPRESISELSGQNTSSEMASIRAHPEYWKDKRCAIVTSAFHMPRAMQLASRVGITAEPVVVDYRSGSGPLTLNQFIPEAEDLMRLQLIFKEWIGMQIGR